MRYELPLFRPPSEARSSILQATLGGSWNTRRSCSSVPEVHLLSPHLPSGPALRGKLTVQRTTPPGA